MTTAVKNESVVVFESETPAEFYFHYWRVDNKVKLVFGDDFLIVKNVQFLVPMYTKYQTDKSPSLIVQGMATQIEFNERTDTAIVTNSEG